MSHTPEPITRAEMILRWVDYCGLKTQDWTICAAGIDIINEDNHQFYAECGLAALYRRATETVHGPEDHPAWPCGLKPSGLGETSSPRRVESNKHH